MEFIETADAVLNKLTCSKLLQPVNMPERSVARPVSRVGTDTRLVQSRKASLNVVELEVTKAGTETRLLQPWKT
jgi:hypothetical protein